VIQKNQVFLYNLICQFEHFLRFVKFMLKLLVLKIKISEMILRNWIYSSLMGNDENGEDRREKFKFE